MHVTLLLYSGLFASRTMASTSSRGGTNVNAEAERSLALKPRLVAAFLSFAEIAAVFLVLFLSDGRDVPKIWDDDAKHYAWTTSAFDVFVLVVVRALLVWAQVCGLWPAYLCRAFNPMATIALVVKATMFQPTLTMASPGGSNSSSSSAGSNSSGAATDHDLVAQHLPAFVMIVVMAVTSGLHSLLSFAVVRTLTNNARRAEQRATQQRASMQVRLLEAYAMDHDDHDNDDKGSSLPPSSAGTADGKHDGKHDGDGTAGDNKGGKGASLGRLVLLAGPEKWLLIWGTIALVFSSAAQMVVPSLFGALINTIAKNGLVPGGNNATGTGTGTGNHASTCSI